MQAPEFVMQADIKDPSISETMQDLEALQAMSISEAKLQAKLQAIKDLDIQFAEDLEAKHQRLAREQKETADMIDPANNIRVQDGSLIFQCPYCGGVCFVLASEINCSIFTHGVTSSGQVNPHITEADVRKEPLISGCAGQYQLQKLENGKYAAVKCSGL